MPLDNEEITRVARVCVERFGFDSIRLTGGEPLLRRDLPQLVQMLAGKTAIRDLALTTNGVMHRMGVTVIAFDHRPDGVGSDG